ncbi:MAG: hypothetical protein AAFQ98_06680 [Bacteroidota bacterium]
MKLISLAFLLSYLPSHATDTPDYSEYHKAVTAIEEHLVAEQFQEALAGYEELLSSYEFVFLRDLKVASQLAAYLGQDAKACAWVRRGMAAGWSWKQIRKMSILQDNIPASDWDLLKENYNALHAQFESWAYTPLRDEVKELMKRDQQKALGNFLRITDKGKTRHAEQVFAPQSEQHVKEIVRILKTQGFPGEQLIGNNVWASTLLSHHNSISKAYNERDKLYPPLGPLLQASWLRGELSPWEWALMEDWRMASMHNHQKTRYGFLGTITDAAEVDQNRAEIGLRSLALRNSLVDLQEQTGINFYLPGGYWQPGKIELP